MAREKKSTCLRRLFPLLLLMGLWMLLNQGPVRVLASDICRVTFTDNAGTSTAKSYTDLAMTVGYGSSIRLPAVPVKTGSRGLGWTTVKKGTEVLYESGERVRILKNTTFYAVTEKADVATATFALPLGARTAAYKKLTSRVNAGETIKLPAVPNRSGYGNLGWSLKKNAGEADYEPGDSFTLTEDTCFYAVQGKLLTVTLRKNGGGVYKKEKVIKGESYELPSAVLSKKKTFLGWSLRKKQALRPKYLPGQSLTINRDRTFYMTVYPAAKETYPEKSELASAAARTDRYNRVIYVGDDRLQGMQASLIDYLGAESSLTANISFVSARGADLSWLQEEGYYELMSIVRDRSSASAPIAIIFNLGVNDLEDYPDYISYLQSLGSRLSAQYNVKLFFQSVEPVNEAAIEAGGIYAKRTLSQVRAFNGRLKSALSGLYSYIDTFSMLLNTGYVSPDGLHFRAKTYLRLFAFAMGRL